jgi:pyroglutamyl-peptidase
MKTVLVAGFGPFPGAPKNPSADLVCALARRRRPALSDVRIVSAVLPTTYAAIANELLTLLKQHDPDLVVFFGVATRAKHLRIESRAVNAASEVHPDVHGRKLPTKKIVPDAPAELTVRAALRHVAAAVRNADITALHSRDAGRYICNAALFTTLDVARRTGRPEQVALIHIPNPRGRRRSARPRMTELVRAGEAALVAFTSANRRS